MQQIGTGVGSDKTLGDGTVAADGPLWSADGKTLWFPQTADMIKFSVAADGTVSDPVSIPLETATINLTTGDTTTPDLPSGMALNPDGTKLYVALNGVNELGVIDTATNKLTQVIHVGNAPRQVVLVGNNAFVSNEGGRPAKPGDYTNESDGTAVVASKVTGARDHRHGVRGQPGHRQGGQGDPGRPGADGRVPGRRRHPHGGQLQRRHVLADRHEDRDRRADRQRQPAAGLDRRQLPERDHDAGQPPHPGQHRPGQRAGRVRLQRRRASR